MAFKTPPNNKNINTDTVTNDDVIYTRHIDDMTDGGSSDVKSDVSSDVKSDVICVDNGGGVGGSVGGFINESFYRLSFRGSDDNDDVNDDVVINNKGVCDVDIPNIG